MSDTSIIKKSTLKKIADAIRVKTNKTGRLKVADFPNLIRGIEGGGSGEVFDIASLRLLLGGQLETEPIVTELIIPEGIEKIGGYAFYQTNMTSLVLPSTLTYFRESSSLSGCTLLQEVTFLGDWNSNISLPNKASIKTVYCHSWYYDKFKASPSTAYISTKLKCLHDTDLTELVVKGLNIVLVPNISVQLEVIFNEFDSAFDEQRGYHWEIEGVDSVKISSANVLTVIEDAEPNKEFTIKCVSDYDPNIVWSITKTIKNVIAVYNRGAEDEKYILTNQNAGTITVTRNEDNIYTRTSSGVYADVCTLNRVDLTYADTVKFYGKINSTNGELGHIFVTNDATVKHTSTNCVRRVQLNTTVKYYEIDVSDLTGEYYIGFGGSNRTVTCYELLVI